MEFIGTELQLLGLVLLSMVLGGTLGFEREVADKPAGLRTHMIVAAAATFLTGIADILVHQVGIDTSLVQADPIRIIEAVITGITFLGAGTIIRNREDNIEGLTTAASLLFASALGIGVALRLFVLTIGSTVMLLVVLRVLKKFGKKI